MTSTIFYAGFIPVNGTYAVIFPDFKGCNSQGDTLEDAFTMAIEALSGHMIAMADDGDVMPNATPKEDILQKLKEQYAELDLGELPPNTVLYPVPAPLLDMRTKQVAVSFSKYKLDMIDRKAQVVGMTRSGFLAAAASAFEVQKQG